MPALKVMINFFSKNSSEYSQSMFRPTRIHPGTDGLLPAQPRRPGFEGESQIPRAFRQRMVEKEKSTGNQGFYWLKYVYIYIYIYTELCLCIHISG